MNSLESVRKLLTQYLQEASPHTLEVEKMRLILDKKDFLLKVYNAFFNLIADPVQSPESLICILDTYTSGLDGFSTNKSIQTLVAFSCMEGLASRRPDVLIGPWETLVWIFVKYSSFSCALVGYTITNMVRNALNAFKKTNKATTLNLISKFASQELCPNPCLRLELFRFIRVFYCIDSNFYHKTFRYTVINSIFELCDNNAFLTVDKVPNFSPMDLQALMEDNNISMEFIMNDYDLDLKKSEIIAAIIKFTRNFALLMKEKHQRLNNIAIEHESNWHLNLKYQLSACLSFCGLIPEIPDDDIDHNENHNDSLLYLVQAVGKDSFLLNYVIDTLDTITQVSLSFPDIDDLHESVIYKKDKLLHRFFKGHINRLPKHQYLQEIHGGTSPAAEYYLRYLQNNSMDQYNDSEYDSECYTSDENDNGLHESVENDSETDISDEERSAVVYYRGDLFYDRDFFQISEDHIIQQLSADKQGFTC